jgi:hypothetical protein
MLRPILLSTAIIAVLATPALADSRSFTVAPFSQASISSAISAEITVGGPQSIVVENATASALNTLRVSVVDGRLKVWRERGFLDHFTLEDQALNLKITVPALTRIDADSASTVSATGITGDKVEVNAGSAASVSIDGLVTKAATISASSAATITLSGSCEVAEVVLSSAGTIHGPAFECVDLDVTASSSARGVLYASGQVNGVASSAAYVELYGDPDHVDDEISSGADIDVH